MRKWYICTPLSQGALMFSPPPHLDTRTFPPGQSDTVKIRPLSRSDHTVEGDTARGTTALVYLQLHSSLYTGTVHVLSSVV